MVAYYFLFFILALILLLLVVSSGSEHTIHQSLLEALIAIANGGYLALAISNNLEEALLANKLCYLGGAFMPMVFFTVLCEICGVTIPYLATLLMYGVQMILYLIICTTGYSEIYYKAAEYHMENGVAYLTKTYGPFHVFYLVTMFGYIAAGTFLVIKSMRQKNRVSFKNMLIMIFSMGAGASCFVLERLMGWTVELMPAVYVIVSGGLTWVLYRANLFLLDSVTDQHLRQFTKVGHVCFNKKMHLMSYSDFVADVFPDIKAYNLDYALPDTSSFFHDKILLRLLGQMEGKEKPASSESNIIEIRDAFYEFHMDPLYSQKGRWRGYVMVLADVTDHQKYLKMIEEYNHNLESEVKGKTQKIRQIQEKTLLGMAQMVESRDLSTGGHIKRTSSVVAVFAKALLTADMGFTPEFLRYVERSAPMHDLGKITVEDCILRKQGKFTQGEYEEMKKHAAEGAKIVRQILTGIEDRQFVTIATNVAHYHHEKVNGTGYPDGLKGDEIPVEARIMALADVFDALVSKRCYKEAFSYEKAFEIIRQDAGSHFDAKLAEVFLSCRPELEALYLSFEAAAEE